MSILFQHNISTQDILNNDIVIISISKKEVKKQRFNRINKLINLFEKCGKNVQGKLVITFEYDDVTEEIYEVKEIRDWVQKLFEMKPHIFYFLSTYMQNIKMITACITDITTVKEKSLTFDQMINYHLNGLELPNVLLEIKLKTDTCLKIINAVTKYGEKVGDTNDNIAEILKNIPGIMKCINFLNEEG